MTAEGEKKILNPNDLLGKASEIEARTKQRNLVNAERMVVKEDPRDLSDFFKLPETIKNKKKEDVEVPLMGAESQLLLMHKCKKLFIGFNDVKGSLLNYVAEKPENMTAMFDIFATVMNKKVNEVKDEYPLYEMVGLLKNFLDGIASFEVLRLNDVKRFDSATL